MTKTKRSFDIGEDAARLEDLCRATGDVRLIVIDPVSAYMGRADSHKNADVRAALAPLAAMAAEIGACIVLVAHLNKNAEGGAMTRVSGSGAFVAAARWAWLVGKHPTVEGTRALVPLKNNIGDDETGFTYRIEGTALPSGINTSRVVFDSSPITLLPDELLKAGSQQCGEPDSNDDTALADAIEFLRIELFNGKRAAAKSLRSKAGDAGIAWRTVERAKKRLGVTSKKCGEEWRWSLPDESQDRQGRHLRRDEAVGGLDVEDRHDGGHGNLGGVGGLGALEEPERVPPGLAAQSVPVPDQCDTR